MNWITKNIKAGEKIKTAINKRASKKKKLQIVIGLHVVKARY